MAMTRAGPWNQARIQVRAYRAQFRFCLRVTVAALLAFALAQVLTIPLHGLWAVLTAVVVTQMSVGGSLRATAEYVVGKLSGAIYASALGVKFPVAAGKAANLVGERPMPSIARFGRLAYPMRGEVTNRAVLGRKRHGRPGIRSGWPAVGTTWVAANSEA